MNKVTKWGDVSFILSSSYRKSILQKSNDPITPSKLSKELNINKTHISRALKELSGKEMIKCLTPNATKGRIYKISDYGKNILQELSKIKD